MFEKIPRGRPRILTKQKRVRSNYIMSKKDLDLMIAASLSIGESRSEFLRVAVRERALRILAGEREIPVPATNQ